MRTGQGERKPIVESQTYTENDKRKEGLASLEGLEYLEGWDVTGRGKGEVDARGRERRADIRERRGGRVC